MAVNLNTINNNLVSMFSKNSSSLNKRTDNENGNENISAAEKKYFANMYPANKDQIMSYHSYERNGKLNAVTIGSNFDRRG